MKYKSILLLLLMIATTLPYSVYSVCLDLDPMDLNKLIIVDCTPKKNENNIDINNFQTSDELFQINFKCQITDQDKCDKVKKAFDMAGDIITNSLALNTPIIVNAKFSVMDLNQLGGASPTRFIPLYDSEDKVERFYPQALVKQFQLQQLPVAYADSDITAEFNSLINWYTPDDKGPIRGDQYDILYTVLHEIIHGLGFVSSWRGIEVPENELTPFVVTDANDPTVDIPESPFKFYGFRETIFDKFIVTRTNDLQQRLSTFSDVLNQFNSNATAYSEFYNQFQNSPQFGAAQKVLEFSTTKNALIFMPRGGKSIMNDGVVLETKIIPFQAGSSISHVDSLIYNVGSPDFLMRSKSVLGITMETLIERGQNPAKSGIGPKLLKILNSIGYNLTDVSIKSSQSSASRRSIVIDFTLIFQISLCICIIFITSI